MDLEVDDLASAVALSDGELLLPLSVFVEAPAFAQGDPTPATMSRTMSRSKDIYQDIFPSPLA